MAAALFFYDLSKAEAQRWPAEHERGSHKSRLRWLLALTVSGAGQCLRADFSPLLANIKGNMGMKKLHLVSLGCPKNLVDSEVMLAALEADGCRTVDRPEEADILVVNTCGFIQSAAEEAIDTILEMARYKEKDPGRRLVVTGCLVQRYGAELAASLPEVDCLIGLDDFPNKEAFIFYYFFNSPSIILIHSSNLLHFSLDIK